MNNSAIGADQKITVCKHRSSVSEVHRMAYGFLSRNKVQLLVGLALFASCAFLNGDEFHISELSKGVASASKASDRPRGIERVFMSGVALPVQGDESLSWLRCNRVDQRRTRSGSICI